MKYTNEVPGSTQYIVIMVTKHGAEKGIGSQLYSIPVQEFLNAYPETFIGHQLDARVKGELVEEVVVSDMTQFQIAPILHIGGFVGEDRCMTNFS
jgi:hypothetical protein